MEILDSLLLSTTVKIEFTLNFTNYLQNYFQMQINKKYGYIRVSSKSQESNSSIKYQKEQLIQNKQNSTKKYSNRSWIGYQ